MKYKKIFFCSLLFMAMGELMIRFDETFKFLDATHVVKVATELNITPEYSLIKNNAINLSGNNFRIMVLGDSYIHGAGIEFKDNFSQQLKLMLQKSNSKFDDVYVLDLSKPSSNSFDNDQAYLQFADKFKPNVVILGYNYNDVDGDLEKQKGQQNIDSFAKANFTSKENESQSFAKKIYNIIYQSSFVHYALTNLNTQLKAYGIVLPYSEFSVKMNAYSINNETWKKSKVILQELIEETRKKNTQLIVLKFPEINLIEYPGLFTKADDTIKGFFTAFPSVIYINGSDIFKGESSKEYILSKYDGHPNEKAHKKLAENIFSLINKTFLGYSNSK
jgi:hypothetical protein